MKHVFALFALFAIQAFACDFQYDPVSATRYYRQEGWKLPGADASVMLSAPTNLSGLPIPKERIPEAGFEIINAGVVEFPAQQFQLDGAKQRMRAAHYGARILKWTINSRTVAYSYGLIPVTAHREKGEWVVDSEAGCIFDATFIDDKGDGVFRVMVPGPFAANLVPSWARAKTN